MKKPREPTKPRPLKRKGRPYYLAQYWEDKVDDQGNLLGRRQVQVALFDEQRRRITRPRAAERGCDALHKDLLEQYRESLLKPESLAAYKERYIRTHLRRLGTSRYYDTKLTQFFTFLHEQYDVTAFSQVAREMVKSFLDFRLEQVKLVTAYGDLRAIRAFFNEARRDGYLSKNPSQGIALPALRGRNVSLGFFLPNEMNAIIAHCERNDPRWFPIFAGYRYAPFRREELCYLEWDDLDFTRDVIHIRDEKQEYNWKPKRDGRVMDLHPTLKDVLVGLERVKNFVYIHPDGASFDDPVRERRELGRKAWRKLKSLCEMLELDQKDETGTWKRRFCNGATLKGFRSGVCCELQLKGVPLGYVQEQLGHHDSSLTLESYTHLVPTLMGTLTKKFIARLGAE